MRLVWALLAVAAFGGAEASAAWQQVGQAKEEAHSREEFQDLQRKYPDYFSGEDASVVTYGYVQFEDFEFRGPSLCRSNDQRLRQRVVTFGACEGGNRSDQCFQTMASPIPQGDPCRARQR